MIRKVTSRKKNKELHQEANGANGEIMSHKHRGAARTEHIKEKNRSEAKRARKGKSEGGSRSSSAEAAVTLRQPQCLCQLCHTHKF